MADNYGRNITGQGGTAIDYGFKERAASDYMSTDQQLAYTKAKDTLSKPMDPAVRGFKGQRKVIDDREKTNEQLDRLRNIAGVNALGEFEHTSRTDFAKPWKLHADQGFLTSEKIGTESPELVMPEKTHGRSTDASGKIGPSTAQSRDAMKLNQVGGGDNAVMGFADANATWAQRYESMRRGRTVDDKGFKGEGSTDDVPTDERIALRQKFMNMRLGIDLPQLSVHKGGSKLKGYHGNFNEDPTGMVFDEDFKRNVVNLSMKNKPRKGAFAAMKLKNVKKGFGHGGPRGVIKELGISQGMNQLQGGGAAGSLEMHAANKMANGMGISGGGIPQSVNYPGSNYGAPSPTHSGRFGTMLDQLEMHPEDVYAGTWGAGSGS